LGNIAKIVRDYLVLLVSQPQSAVDVVCHYASKSRWYVLQVAGILQMGHNRVHQGQQYSCCLACEKLSGLVG